MAMWDWLNKRRAKADLALTGAPAVRRQKTYSAQSGYVYQYFYQGMRTLERRGAPCAEYVFEVTADRRKAFCLSVFLPEPALSAWVKEHARDFSAAERYGLAKMALFQAFDERPDPAALTVPVELRPADVQAITEMLDL